MKPTSRFQQSPKVQDGNRKLHGHWHRLRQHVQQPTVCRSKAISALLQQLYALSYLNYGVKSIKPLCAYIHSYKRPLTEFCTVRMFDSGVATSGAAPTSLQQRARDAAADKSGGAQTKAKQLRALVDLADGASKQLRQLRLQNAALRQRSHVLERYINTRGWQLEVLKESQQQEEIGATLAKANERSPHWVAPFTSAPSDVGHRLGPGAACIQPACVSTMFTRHWILLSADRCCL